MINELAKEIHQNNVKKGFYEDEKNIGEMLALIHSEVSEALEADRKGFYVPIENRIDWLNDLESDSEFKSDFTELVKDTFEDELADIMIRVMDLAAHKEINLEEHIKGKLRYNKMREYKHGKRY
ncbi:hypothetical protein SAMN04489761_4267 [Tenacibaculum sp. MAR_2009_124]|uniref:hypothetical protein n=1 Tax=Tenacibaculum sp. MAR_2009_124 TaxID=1250059 RepID=UPI00089D71C5|nr:hypothetical protein [Tenacibaculum sp. MAR_2009_124]SED09844.1 hypothetical protein SAMN04489761_4267 [Tenacibaculum sp. MAR_2009_124]